MRSEQLLIVLLAAVAAGRPVPAVHDGDLVARELQYADIAAAYAVRHVPGAHDSTKARRELQYSEIVALSGPPPASRHGTKHYVQEDHQHWDGHHARKGHHHAGEGHDYFEDHQHWDGHHARKGHHHAGEGHDYFDGTLISLFSEARSDVSTRVLEGIKLFFSHAAREVSEEAEHEHKHDAGHPQGSVVNNILEFLSKATR